MSVYITGDCHADWSRFEENVFYEQNSMTPEDFVIVLGDFGILDGGMREETALNRLAEKPFTTLFVDGNHENFDRLFGDEFPEMDYHGGRAKQIRENIIYLERGYVFEFCGKTFFAFGGASSYDIQDGILDVKGHTRHAAGEDAGMYYKYIDEDFENDEVMLQKFHSDRSRYRGRIRVNHHTWWSQEMPNEDEMMRGLHNLDANGNRVDFIITHCAPQEIVSVMYRRNQKADPVTRYFNQVNHIVKFDRWFFGHYHDDRAILGNKYLLMYEQILRIV